MIASCNGGERWSMRCPKAAMRVCREGRGRRAITNSHNDRVPTRVVRRSLSTVGAVVLSSDQRALAIELDYLFGRSDCPDDTFLEEENAVAEATEEVERVSHEHDCLPLFLEPV